MPLSWYWRRICLTLQFDWVKDRGEYNSAEFCKHNWAKFDHHDTRRWHEDKSGTIVSDTPQVEVVMQCFKMSWKNCVLLVEECGWVTFYSGHWFFRQKQGRSLLCVLHSHGRVRNHSCQRPLPVRRPFRHDGSRLNLPHFLGTLGNFASEGDEVTSFVSR